MCAGHKGKWDFDYQYNLGYQNTPRADGAQKSSDQQRRHQKQMAKSDMKLLSVSPFWCVKGEDDSTTLSDY